MLLSQLFQKLLVQKIYMDSVSRVPFLAYT